MPTSPAVKSAAPSAGQDVLIILGAEILLVGGLAASIALRAGPFLVTGVGAVVVAALAGLTATLERSVWRRTANAILALFLSFASMLPGIFFFVELQNRGGGVCYERPWFRAAGAWLIFGPILVIGSMSACPWRLSSPSLFIIRALHALVWLLAAGNTMLCAMMV